MYELYVHVYIESKTSMSYLEIYSSCDRVVLTAVWIHERKRSISFPSIDVEQFSRFARVKNVFAKAVKKRSRVLKLVRFPIVCVLAVRKRNDDGFAGLHGRVERFSISRSITRIEYCFKTRTECGTKRRN